MPQRNEEVGVTRADIDHAALSATHGEAWKAMGETFDFVAQAEERERAMSADRREGLSEKYSALRKNRSL